MQMAWIALIVHVLLAIPETPVKQVGLMNILRLPSEDCFEYFFDNSFYQFYDQMLYTQHSVLTFPCILS